MQGLKPFHHARGVGLAALVVVAALAAPPAPAGPRAASCEVAGSKTLRANAFARLYSRRDDLWACVRATGRRLRLADAYGHDYGSATWRNVRLSGRFAAWTLETYDISCKAACPPDYSPTQVSAQAHDLRARREVNRIPWGHRFVLTNRGGLAWLEPRPQGGSVLYGKAPGEELVQVLDSGPIDAASVRAYHRLVLWRTDGQRRWARLP